MSTSRETRVLNALKASESYQALEANPSSFFSISSDHDDDDDQEINQVEKTLAQIHYHFAIQDYQTCFDLSILEFQKEIRLSKRLMILDNLLITSKCLISKISDPSILLKLVNLSQPHWKQSPALGLSAASLLLEIGSHQATVIQATIPAILHCGDSRIQNFILKALSSVIDPIPLLQTFIDQLISEKVTPAFIAQRFKLFQSQDDLQSVPWTDIKARLLIKSEQFGKHMVPRPSPKG